jgi:hypothetical protein
MINNKNFNYFIITYLIISTGIYNIIYWSKFGINGLSLLSIDDTITIGLNSIFYTFISAILGVFIAFIWKNKIFKDEKTYTKKELFITTFQNIIILSIIYFLMNKFFKTDSLEIIFLFITFIIIPFINKNIVFDKSFNININKDLLLIIIIYLPLNLISTAITKSNNIYQNKDFMYTKIKAYTTNGSNSKNLKNNDTINSQINNHEFKNTRFDTLKLLGRDNDFFIFTDLKNINIYFIKNDTIELKKK